MERKPPPPARAPRTNTPLVFSNEAAWSEKCDAMDAINDQLAPLMDESQALEPQRSDLRTSELSGKPAFQDYMGARRQGYRAMLDFPAMGGEYTVEHMAAIRNNLASTPDYIERIKDGLAENADFAAKRPQIDAGLEALRALTADMQAMAQKALNDFAKSADGKSAAGKAIAERYVTPPDTEIKK